MARNAKSFLTIVPEQDVIPPKGWRVQYRIKGDGTEGPNNDQYGNTKQVYTKFASIDYLVADADYEGIVQAQCDDDAFSDQVPFEFHTDGIYVGVPFEVLPNNAKLGTVGGLSLAVQNGAKILATWNTVGNADYYELQISEDNVNWITIQGSAATSRLCTGFSPNSTYYFRVRACRRYYPVGDYSSVASATTNGTATDVIPIFEAKTTGSISAGQSVITIAAMPGDYTYKVGDTLIMEIGGEVGQGARGTLAVGDNWPGKRYNTQAALLADVSQPDGKYAWALDNGETMRWDGNGQAWNQYTFHNEYADHSIPKCLRGVVTAVNGLRITLDVVAATDSTNANVYLDNGPIINGLFAQGGILQMPAGKFAVAETLYNYLVYDVRLQGKFGGVTELFSPKGAPSLTIQYFKRGEANLFHHTGNVLDDGFGFSWWLAPGEDPTVLAPDTEYWENPFRVRGGVCIYDHGCVARNLTVKDVFTYGVQGSGTGTWIDDCHVIESNPRYKYIGWNLHMTGAVGGGIRNCTFTAPKISNGMEAFQSLNVYFSGIRITNGLCALNGSSDTYIEDTISTMEAGSKSNFINSGHPFWDINSFMGDTAGGAIFRNVHCIQNGLISDDLPVIKGFYGRANTPNVQIYDSSYTVPDNAFTAQALTLEATNCMVDNFQCTGRLLVAQGSQPGYNYCNIAVFLGDNKNSFIRNTTAQYIKVSTGVVTENNTCEVCR